MLKASRLRCRLTKTVARDNAQRLHDGKQCCIAGAKMTDGLPCDRCVGRSLNLCKPLDDARLKAMLGLGGIRHWKKHEMIFRAGDPMGAFFKIRSGIVAVSRTPR